MSVVLLDEFRGALAEHLADHTPNIGSAWSITGGLTPQLDGAVELQASPWLYNGGLWVPNSGAVAVPACGTSSALAGADAAVSCQVIVPTVGGGQSQAGPVARWNGTTSYYAAMYDQDNAVIHLLKKVAGVENELQTYSAPFGAGEAVPLKLTVVGNQLTVTIGNDEQAPETDNSIATAGKAGLIILTNGAHALNASLVVQQFLCVQL